MKFIATLTTNPEDPADKKAQQTLYALLQRQPSLFSRQEQAEVADLEVSLRTGRPVTFERMYATIDLFRRIRKHSPEIEPEHLDAVISWGRNYIFALAHAQQLLSHDTGLIALDLERIRDLRGALDFAIRSWEPVEGPDPMAGSPVEKWQDVRQTVYLRELQMESERRAGS
jgi:hypothetical protein